MICIRCDKELEDVFVDANQPLDGIAFMTQGHYGSAYFDPMDGSYLQIAVCDRCVENLEKSKNYVFRNESIYRMKGKFNE